MISILQNFLEHSNQTSGLMLLPLTTGSGKTHNVLKYIADYLKREREKKVFFITTQKKNLPVEKLFHFYKDRDFDSRVLRIQSVMDCVNENLNTKLEEEIRHYQPTLANSTNFKILMAVRNDIKANGDNYAYRMAEKDFRYDVIHAIKSELETDQKDIILQTIKNDKKWNWLGRLYPMVYTSERQVYFLSMDKFMLPYHTLVEQPCRIIDSEWFKGAYVFIDEFDATKETMLNRIIEDKNNSIDLISLTKDIIKGLKYTEFPAVYTDNKWDANAINKNIENFNQLNEEFSLKYAFKTSEGFKYKDSFLFHDNGYWGQTTEKNLLIETNIKLKQNIIKSKDDGTSNYGYTLRDLLSRIQNKLTFFQNGVTSIALNYTHKNGVKLIDSVNTFLNLILEHPKDAEYISSQIMAAYCPEQNGTENMSWMDDFDLSFYKKGFRYTRLINEPNNAEQSKVNLYACNKTPESIMEKMAKTAKVVGISATATLKTVLGNYDIDYLQRKLQDKYYELSEYEKKQLAEFLAKSKQHYYKTKINVDFTDISENEYTDEIWNSIVSKNDALDIVEKLNIKYWSDTYLKYRFYKISWAFKKFVSHKDIKSFLCFMNLHPKEGNELDTNTLSYIFDRINGKPGKAKDMVQYLNSIDYDNNLTTIKTRLSRGEKLFVISVYKTLGTGQNPQYTIPEGVECEKINDLYESNEKDFDAVYLDKPTNLISNLNGEQKWNDKEFMKYVFEIEYLCQNGDISEAQKREYINAGSLKMLGQTTWNINIKDKFKAESLQPVKGLATQILNQALGRFCRTNKKNKNIYIFADRDITEVIDPTVKESIPLSPEFERFLDELEKLGIQKVAPTKYEENAKKNSINASRTINGFLKWNDEWAKNKVNQWNFMRLEGLCTPVLYDDQDFKKCPLCDMFIECDPSTQRMAYWYNQSGDYEYIKDISFKEKLSREVSEADCQLNLLLRIPGIKELFEREGYATSWKLGKYMMSPAFYNNIYKGALGEVIGKQIFKDSLKMDLCEIDDYSVYEFFDFKLPKKPVFVDFKKWKEVNLGPEKSGEIRDEIFRKAKKCKAETVLVVNIIAQKERECRKENRDGCTLIEVPQLYVIDNETLKPSIDTIRFILENI